VVWTPPAVADANGDGVTEILVAVNQPGDEGALLVIRGDGRLLWRAALPAAVTCGPLVGDVNADGELEVLVADRTGRLHCYATGAVGPVEWGLPGGDSHNTRNERNAYHFSQTPAGLQAAWQPAWAVD
jgi:hypothetical protein